MGWAGTESVGQLLSLVNVTRKGPAHVSDAMAGQRELPPATGTRRRMSLSTLPCSAAQTRERTAWASAEARAVTQEAKGTYRRIIRMNEFSKLARYKSNTQNHFFYITATVRNLSF